MLHIGGDIIIPARRIIAIMSASASSAESLKTGHKKETIGTKTKSIIITEDRGEKKVYFSPISTLTLEKRCGFVKNIGF
ncbi:MAG: extracellular matrix regulator RemB [Christensenellales bacterium]|jgi:regulator of extracellular matrix RemA (YlzA/DUF370 family)